MVRTRIAPSPTGNDIHIGNLYAAYINWVFAKKHKGNFIVRIEDTDRTRYVQGAEEKILNSLEAFGITASESPRVNGPYKPYRQSERLSLYKKYADELVKKGAAYYCFCSKERLEDLRKNQQDNKQETRYDKYCLHNLTLKQAEEKSKKERYVIRLNVPSNTLIKFNDLVRGEIVINSDTIDDQVLLKSDGFPTYHLAVVVDDHKMKISHVIRAEEWLSSTPKHVLLYKAFNWELPIFAHLPILRNSDHSKLSKRKNPVWASWYLEQGFLAEAVLNYLALMGWSHPKQIDIFSTDEFIKVFELTDVHPVGPVFDTEKLKWLNGEYLRKLRITNYELRITNYLALRHPELVSGSVVNKQLIKKSIPLIQTRIQTLAQYYPMCEFFFKAPEQYEKNVNKEWIERVSKLIETLSQWKHQTMYEDLTKLSDKLGISKSKLFMDIRIAIMGKKIGPPLFESMEILGKEECVKRIKISIQ